MNTRIALVDWDGTIRKGFTLPDWVQFLRANSTCDDTACHAALELFDAFHEHRISHDELADLNAEAYHDLLCSVQDDIGQLAAAFVRADARNLIPDALGFLHAMADRGYQVHIISGAPKEILTVHMQDVPVHALHTLDVSTSPCDLPKVRHNPGVSSQKRDLTARVLDNGGIEHVIALGNSSSDIPMLDAAHMAVVVDNPDLAPKCDCLHHITSHGGYGPLQQYLPENGSH